MSDATDINALSASVNEPISVLEQKAHFSFKWLLNRIGENLIFDGILQLIMIISLDGYKNKSVAFTD